VDTVRRLLLGILVVAVGLFVSFGTAWLVSDEVKYLTRAGAEQARILERARPLDKVIADPKTDAATRGLLQLVIDVRRFADSIGFAAGETYTTYSDVGRDTLLLVVSASGKSCICPHVWKYPIVGRVPYKGFFDPKMARAEAERLEKRGLDTYLRPSGAYATLGWFNDPLLSTALTRDSMELAATVFHEMAHNTLYVKSATPFNESFAQYAGYHAAARYFSARGDSLAARRALDRWADERVLAGYYHSLITRLEDFYASKPDSATLDSGRVALGTWSRDTLTQMAPLFKTFRIGPMAARPINNARLVGVLIYRTNLDWFEQWHQSHNNDVRESVAALSSLMTGVTGDSAFVRLQSALRQ
jgi:predicted aminopeptidase